MIIYNMNLKPPTSSFLLLGHDRTSCDVSVPMKSQGYTRTQHEKATLDQNQSAVSRRLFSRQWKQGGKRKEYKLESAGQLCHVT